MTVMTMMIMLNDTFQINKVTLSEIGMGLQISDCFSNFKFLTVPVFDPPALWQLFILFRHHSRLSRGGGELIIQGIILKVTSMEKMDRDWHILDLLIMSLRILTPGNC